MKTNEVLIDWQLNPAASDAAILEAGSTCDDRLPLDYVEFLQKQDGGEGFIGENYLILWKAEELAVFNREYEVDKYAPGLLLFGSNGGGEGYAFDKRQQPMSVVRVPFIGMDLRYARPVADSFISLLSCLAER